MTDHKRESDFHAENALVKRSKFTVGDTVLSRNQPISSETNGDKEHSLDTRTHEMNRLSEDQVSCDSQQASKVVCIEADAAEDRGTRRTMEDTWLLLPDASLGYPGRLRCAHFAIYDGHGGRLAAEYAQCHLHANVLSAGLPRELMDIKAARKAIVEDNWNEGATAVCVWVLGQTVLVANIGDAKAVLARSSIVDGPTSFSERGSSLKAIVVTREHKAIYPQERARIQKAGGCVGPNGRLQGRLEVSRAFGDLQFKKKQLQEKASVTTAARRLVREAVRERRCKDNCTAIVIVFKHN